MKAGLRDATRDIDRFAANAEKRLDRVSNSAGLMGKMLKFEMIKRTFTFMERSLEEAGKAGDASAARAAAAFKHMESAIAAVAVTVGKTLAPAMEQVASLVDKVASGIDALKDLPQKLLPRNGGLFGGPKRRDTSDYVNADQDLLDFFDTLKRPPGPTPGRSPTIGALIDDVIADHVRAKLPELEQEPIAEFDTTKRQLEFLRQRGDLGNDEFLGRSFAAYDKMLDRLGLKFEKTAAQVHADAIDKIDRLRARNFTDPGQDAAMRETANQKLLDAVADTGVWENALGLMLGGAPEAAAGEAAADRMGYEAPRALERGTAEEYGALAAFRRGASAPGFKDPAKAVADLDKNEQARHEQSVDLTRQMIQKMAETPRFGVIGK